MHWTFYISIDVLVVKLKLKILEQLCIGKQKPNLHEIASDMFNILKRN